MGGGGLCESGAARVPSVLGMLGAERPQSDAQNARSDRGRPIGVSSIFMHRYKISELYITRSNATIAAALELLAVARATVRHTDTLHHRNTRRVVSVTSSPRAAPWQTAAQWHP